MILLAVLGDQRVVKSLSPAMHNAAFRARGLAGVYLALPVEPAHVGEAVAGLRALGFSGANVTVPHKQAVLPHLDSLSDLARRLGAVNTISLRQGRLEGGNTDVGGFLSALEGAGCPPQGLEALVVGAGGAARAAVLALVVAGARVHVLSRRSEQAQALCAELGGQPQALAVLPDLLPQAGLVVNASAVSAPAESPQMAALLGGLRPGPGCRLVMDLNYGRPANIWQELAARAGVPFQDGLTMLAAQAALSFTIWTVQAASAREFHAALPRV